MAEYDYDFFVIGGGSGGVRAARIAAGHGARTALAEEEKVGGTCVIRGCVPKKLIHHAAHFAEELEDSIGFGWTTKGVAFDWATMLKNVIADTEYLSGIYIKNLEKSGAELIRSRAVVEGPHRIRLLADDRVVTARYILVATGARPHMDDTVEGIEHALCSDDIFRLDRLPKRMVIAGGGYIAVEFASILAAFAVEVTVIHRGAEILRGFDGDVQKHVHAAMERRGITIVTGDRIASIAKREKGFAVKTRGGQEIETDLVLFAIGRRPNTKGLGLESAGVKLDALGEVVVDAMSRSSVDSIYAIGDVTHRLQLTPIAIREGHALADTLFGNHAVMVDYTNVPTAVFSLPEVGTVGMTEEEAKILLPAVDVYRTTFKPLENRVAGRDERMMMKLVVDGDSGRVVGCHIVGPSASEIAQMAAIPIKMGALKSDFDRTVSLHPTVAEELVTLRTPSERHRRQAAE
ncbi:MAG: glutathione-disulfide reductase [Rhizobiales bacterium]|nr:glutathione-disulfide reductase [Hyphomicrobiales bacterium]